MNHTCTITFTKTQKEQVASVLTNMFNSSTESFIHMYEYIARRYIKEHFNLNRKEMRIIRLLCDDKRGSSPLVMDKPCIDAVYKKTGVPDIASLQSLLNDYRFVVRLEVGLIHATVINRRSVTRGSGCH